MEFDHEILITELFNTETGNVKNVRISPIRQEICY